MSRIFDTDDDMVEAAQAQPRTLHDVMVEAIYRQLQACAADDEPVSGYYTDGVRVLRLIDGGRDA